MKIEGFKKYLFVCGVIAIGIKLSILMCMAWLITYSRGVSIFVLMEVLTFVIGLIMGFCIRHFISK